MFRADLVKFLAKPKTKIDVFWRFYDKEYGRGHDRIAVTNLRIIDRQLSAAITSGLVKRERGKWYVASSVGAAAAARMEAALETRRERDDRRLAKGKRS